MGHNIKQIAKRMLPSKIVGMIASRRWWKITTSQVGKTKNSDICQRIMKRYGTSVLLGPFKGLRSTEQCLLAHCSTQVLLGTYEMELLPWFERLAPGMYERIVDIGSAAGFYAVGMALRTGSPVDAYDPSSTARTLCREMAKMNDVSHLVNVFSWCGRESLIKLNGMRCFVLCDCEGYETELLTEDVAHSLSKSDFIIELHDGATAKGTTRRILESRFGKSHSLRVVGSQPRDWSVHPELSFLEFLGEDANLAISENRDMDQEWLVATSISG